MPKIKKLISKNYTVVDNAILQDERLSLKAKGLFVYLWSQPDDWTYYEKEVVRHSKDKLASLRSGIHELEQYGYLSRKRVRKKGQFKEPIWVLNPHPKLFAPKCENRTLVGSSQDTKSRTKKELSTDNVPRFDFPKLEKPTLEKPILENRTLLNTNQTKYLSNKVSISTKLSLTREERDEKQMQEYVVKEISQFFAKYDHPLTKAEFRKLKPKVKGKNLQLLLKAAEKAIYFAETYPFGYFLALTDNVPVMERKAE